MRAFQFSRPKGPGFGISKDFYLSVLSSKSTLPTLLQIINPAGADRAVEGFGAPLMAWASKEALSLPLERGNYALASKDRKTVIHLRVLSKEEAGFDPSAYVRSSLAANAPQELTARMLATWQLLQFSFESHDAAVYPACHFLLDLAQRAGQLCEGVVADPIGGRYLLPEEVYHIPPADMRIDARDFVAIRSRQAPAGLHLYTAGMQKFVLPELEIEGLEESLADTAGVLLYSLCQARLLSKPLESGAKIGAKNLAFELREGGLNKSHREDVAVLELLPPTGVTASDALRAWSKESKG